jgi:Fic family protein
MPTTWPGRPRLTAGVPASLLVPVRPGPLPPRIELTRHTVRLLAEAERALGEWRGIARRGLPDPYLLISPFLRQEAVLSSRIEGTTATLQQLLLYEAHTRAS